jgi:hypothetical protein
MCKYRSGYVKLCVEKGLNFGHAPVHKALSVKQFLAQKSITEMEHSLYSLDLAPNNFCLFSKTVCLKGTEI